MGKKNPMLRKVLFIHDLLAGFFFSSRTSMIKVEIYIVFGISEDISM